MSNNHHHLTPRVRDPECARYAALLPVLDEEGSDPFAAARAREHAAGCARCRAELAAYDRMESALRRHFGPEAAPRLSTADLLWSSTGLPLEVIMRDAPEPTPAPIPAAAIQNTSAPESADQRAFRPLPHIGANRPVRGAKRLIPALSAAAAVAAVLVVAITAQLLFAGSHALPTGTTKGHSRTTATVGANITITQLEAIAMVSSRDGWAVGATSTLNISGTNAGYLMHYDGTQWSPVKLDCACAQSVEVISMVSPTDGWAAGKPGIMLHYDGQNWTTVPLSGAPSTTGGDFAALDMASGTTGWAIQWGDTVWQYAAGTWTAMKLPIIPGFLQPYNLALYGVAGSANGDAWVVGEVDPENSSTTGNNVSVTPGLPTGVILHVTGGQLSVAELLPNTVLHDVSLVAPGEGWAVGENVKLVVNPGLPNAIPPIAASTYQVDMPLALHLQHDQWEQTPTPQTTADFSQGSLMKVAMGNANDGWALEQVTGSYDYYSNSASVSNGLLHYANGQWQQVPFPRIENRYEASVSALVALPSGEAWAVGQAVWQSQPDAAGDISTRVAPLIMQYHTGQWVVVSS